MASATAFLAAGVTAAALSGVRHSRRTRPPVAVRIPHAVLIGAAPGDKANPNALSPPIALADDLFWLRDDARKSPAVLAHLAEENGYTEIVTAGLQPNTEALYREMLSRVKETDSDVPYPWGAFLYYTRTEAGKSYTIHARKPAPAKSGGGGAPHSLDGGAGVTGSIIVDAEPTSSPSERGERGGPSDMPATAAASVSTASPHSGGEGAAVPTASSSGGALACPVPADARPGAEEVLLDENVLAAGRAMCDVNTVAPSPDHALVAYSVDFSGYETYEIKVKAIATGVHAADVITGTNGDVEWGGTNRHLYYLSMDDAHRPNKLWRHTMGTPQSADECLVSEDDERFWLGMTRSRTDAYVFVTSSSKTTAEVHAVPLGEGGKDDGAPHLVAARTDGVLYDVEHYRGRGRHNLFVITTNAGGAKNFKVGGRGSTQRGYMKWMAQW